MMRFSSLYRHLKPHQQLCRSSSNPPPSKSRNPISRALYFLRNDPFARVSIMFGGTVLIVLLIVESFVPKPQKRIKPHVTILPPKVIHPVITRQELDTLSSWIPSFYSLGPLVAMVTGPSGCGKTELMYQFANKFIELCSPWLPAKTSKRPIVLYIDGNSIESLLYSTNICAHVLGIKSHNNDQGTLDSIITKLTEQKGKWLLIIDSITDNTSSVINNSVGKLSGYKYRKGMILLTTQDNTVTSINTNNTISLPQMLSPDETLYLFSLVSGITVSESIDYLNKLSPLSVVLSALTVQIYNHFYQSESTALSKYIQLINENESHPCNTKQPHPFNRSLHLYMQALFSCDDAFGHCIDFISSCNPNYPIPLSTIRHHLKNSFNRTRIPSNQMSPLFVTNDDSLQETQPNNYLSVIKSKLPMMGRATPPINIVPQPKVSDNLISLMMSPFVRLSDIVLYDIQLVHTHSIVCDYIRDSFVNFTIPRLEEAELIRAKTTWNKTAWFRRFRTFDNNNYLTSFIKSLPGIKEGGAYTESQYNQLNNTSVSYKEYIHCVSHYYRIADTIINELRYLRKDNEDLLIRKYLLPHLEYILNNNQHLLTDQVALSYETALLNVRSSLIKTSYDNLVLQYKTILDAHVNIHGTHHMLTANALTSLGELYYHNTEYHDAINVLKQAINIRENIPQRLRTQDYSVDHASSLSLLGLVYAAMGNKNHCIKYLEQAMMLYQIIPADGDITKSQRKVVATTITDLGHAYVLLGDVTSAKKYLDLAIVAQRGIHGDVHPEVVRTLNVQNIVYTLMGDNNESNIIGREAGEIQKELSLQSDII